MKNNLINKIVFYFFFKTKYLFKNNFFSITWYAFFITFGVFIFYFLSYRNLKKKNISTIFIDKLIFNLLVVSLIGARIWYILFSDFKWYFFNYIKIFLIKEGGLAIHGTIIFGILFLYFFIKKYKYDFYIIVDELLPNVLIAQIIGRFGNFINKEAHGDVVEEKFFNYFPKWLKKGMFIEDKYYNPTFIYEIILNFFGFIIIVYFIKKIKKKYKLKGLIFYFYFLWYGLIRFIIELFRLDNLYFFNYKISFFISIFFILFGIVGIFLLFKKKNSLGVGEKNVL